jgi:AcrR family transcriptional regulator
MTVTVITGIIASMGRWEPDASSRLRQAAMELYMERGFERTTVAEIAAQAGVTERTFFRYFADKREVFFSGSEQLQQAIVDGVTNAPASASPIEAVTQAFYDAANTYFAERHAFARQRQTLVDAHTELHERELIKFAKMSAAIAEGLRARGVDDQTASIAAETGLLMLKVGFARWIKSSGNTSLSAYMKEALNDLVEVVAAT